VRVAHEKPPNKSCEDAPRPVRAHAEFVHRANPPLRKPVTRHVRPRPGNCFGRPLPPGGPCRAGTRPDPPSRSVGPPAAAGGWGPTRRVPTPVGVTAGPRAPGVVALAGSTPATPGFGLGRRQRGWLGSNPKGADPGGLTRHQAGSTPGWTAGPRSPGVVALAGSTPATRRRSPTRGTMGGWGQTRQGADPGRGDRRTGGARGRRPDGLDPSHPGASPGGGLVTRHVRPRPGDPFRPTPSPGRPVSCRRTTRRTIPTRRSASRKGGAISISEYTPPYEGGAGGGVLERTASAAQPSRALDRRATEREPPRVHTLHII
jgi:hypothetical protein